MLTQAPRGTNDILPKESYKWRYIEDTIKSVCDLFLFSEIRTPTFEHTELFIRGVGQGTDIVDKEMYTFLDKGDRSITLKPEGTAGVARAFIEHKLYADILPLKAFYFTPVFRYEKPQAGRFREHHQFGIECFGSYDAALDAEVILLAITVFERLGLKDLDLNINSIGCPKCRPHYREILKKYFEDNKNRLCETCGLRIDKNPLRILDCKNPICIEVAKDAPKSIDYLCDECEEHMDNLKKSLDIFGLKYKINPNLVRGLDYYTKTVFEIVSDDLGAQSTVCGGGRYDKLIEECGGPDVPAVGFGMGLERLLLILEKKNLILEEKTDKKVYIAPLSSAERDECIKILKVLRDSGIKAETDIMGKSLKAQMKYSDKAGFTHTVIVGEDELKSGKYPLKDMATGIQEFLTIDKIANALK